MLSPLIVMICFGLSFGENVLNMPAIVNGGAFAGVAKFCGGEL